MICCDYRFVFEVLPYSMLKLSRRAIVLLCENMQSWTLLVLFLVGFYAAHDIITCGANQIPNCSTSTIAQLSNDSTVLAFSALSQNQYFTCHLHANSTVLVKRNTTGIVWNVSATTKRDSSLCVVGFDAFENVQVTILNSDMVTLADTSMSSASHLFFLKLSPQGQVLSFTNFSSSNVLAIPPLAFDIDANLYVRFVRTTSEQSYVGNMSLSYDNALVKITNGVVQWTCILPNTTVCSLTFDEIGNVFIRSRLLDPFTFGFKALPGSIDFVAKISPFGSYQWAVGLNHSYNANINSMTYFNHSLFVITSQVNEAICNSTGVCLVQLGATEGAIVSATLLVGAYTMFGNFQIQSSPTKLMVLGISSTSAPFQYENRTITGPTRFLAQFSPSLKLLGLCPVFADEPILVLGRDNHAHLFDHVNMKVQTTCLACKRGTFFNQEEGYCNACSPGSASSFVNATSCEICESGYYQNGFEAEACIACSAGTYSDKSGMKSCELCAVGKYNPIPAQSTCLHCIAGTYSNHVAKVNIRHPLGLLNVLNVQKVHSEIQKRAIFAESVFPAPYQIQIEHFVNFALLDTLPM